VAGLLIPLRMLAGVPLSFAAAVPEAFQIFLRSASGFAPWHPAQDAGLSVVHNDSPFSDETPRGPVAALQVPPVGAAQTPSVHKAAAVPVVGATLSESENDAPEAVAPAVALQVLLPTVQLMACGAQAASGAAAQVAPAD
jgi:hypothetical protein